MPIFWGGRRRGLEVSMSLIIPHTKHAVHRLLLPKGMSLVLVLLMEGLLEIEGHWLGLWDLLWNM